jgi:hypothetical protein
MNGTRSGLCSMVGLDISSVESLSSTTRELV